MTISGLPQSPTHGLALPQAADAVGNIAKTPAATPLTALSQVETNEIIGTQKSVSQGAARDMSPGDDLNGSHAAQASQRLGSFDQENMRADMYSVMALFQKMAQEMRDSARTERQANTQAKVSELYSSASEITEAAEKRFQGAMISGAFQIAGGVTSMAMGTVSASKQIKGLSIASGPGGPTTQSSTLEIQGKQIGAYGAGVGQIFSGVGEMGKASFDKDASAHDAQSKRNEANAQVADLGIQQADDQMRRMMEIIQDMREKTASMQQADIETNKSIARNV